MTTSWIDKKEVKKIKHNKQTKKLNILLDIMGRLLKG